MKSYSSRLERTLYKKMLKAVRRFDLLRDGDRIMVAISGGKDSYGLLHLLHKLKARAPIHFDLLAVHLDQTQPGYDGAPLKKWLMTQGYAHRIVKEDTYSIVKAKTQPGQAYCFMCSRLRRGILYRLAGELGCTRIALGHHRDDALETLMLNMIFSGQLKSMPPKLLSDDRRNTVIRPLIFCGADELQSFADEQAFPILPCNLCGSQPNLARMKMRDLLSQIEEDYPGARTRMLAALTHVKPSHLVDKALWNRLGLEGLTDSVEGSELTVATEIDDADDTETGDDIVKPTPIAVYDRLGLMDE